MYLFALSTVADTKNRTSVHPHLPECPPAGVGTFPLMDGGCRRVKGPFPHLLWIRVERMELLTSTEMHYITFANDMQQPFSNSI
jgi:hypothetical protein